MEGTGFFSRIKEENRWYLTDPEGYAFFSLGCDCVTARCDARIDGVESLLEPNPSREDRPELYGERTFPWGESTRKPVLFSYERWNLMRAFGSDWYSVWQDMITAQLKQMGVNTLGNWSDPSLFGRMPYVTSLPEFPATKLSIFRDFPDVLSEEYRQEAIRCASVIGDDYLQQQAYGRTQPETFNHGTSAQRSRWLKRGFETGDPGKTASSIFELPDAQL